MAKYFVTNNDDFFKKGKFSKFSHGGTLISKIRNKTTRIETGILSGDKLESFC